MKHRVCCECINTKNAPTYLHMYIQYVHLHYYGEQLYCTIVNVQMYAVYVHKFIYVCMCVGSTNKPKFSSLGQFSLI